MAFKHTYNFKVDMTCYRAGMQAFAQGRPLTSVPPLWGAKEQQSWEMGWHEAANLADIAYTRLTK